MNRVRETETLFETKRVEREIETALRQGMCRPCAVETAEWTVIGLSHMPRMSLSLCRSCERRLNPKPRKNYRTGRYECRPVNRTRPGRKSRARTNAMCRHCTGSFAAKRSDARYCSGRCREAARRARNVTAIPRDRGRV
ncbi:hypothetical protein JCM10369A_44520 [Nocardioides pyridinolyticus]